MSQHDPKPNKAREENHTGTMRLLYNIYTSIEDGGCLYADEETTYQLNDIGLKDLEAKEYVKVLGRSNNLAYDREDDLEIIVTEKGKSLLEERGWIKKIE